MDVSSESYPANKKTTLSLLCLAAVYLFLQIYQHLVTQSAAWVADSVDYIVPAGSLTLARLFSWSQAKLWGAAVLYHLTGTSPQNIDLVQTLISAVIWLYLAWIFSRSVRSPILKVIGFSVLLVFSLTSQVQMWNHVILSESLSISLMVLGIGLWLHLIQHWNWMTLIALLFVLFFWINTREANVYFSFLIAVGIFLLGLIKRNQRFYWLVSCVIILTSLPILQNSERLAMPRWAFSLTNVILQRILPQPEYVDYFAERGMPVPRELRKLEGQWAQSGDFAVFNDSNLNRFERWLYDRGKMTYAWFLISHPAYTLLSPLKDLSSLMADPDLVKTYTPDSHPLFPSLLDELLFPIRWFGIYMWICLALIVSAVFLKPWKYTRLIWLVGALVLLWVPYVYLIWHGDAMEIARHAIQANIQFRLSMLMLGFLAADIWALRFLEKGERQLRRNSDQNPSL